MQLDLNNITTITWIVITIGSLIGSIKANLDDVNQNCLTRLFNTILGLFCGISIAGEYSTGLSFWLSGLLALVGGMLGGTVLDVISELAPNLIKNFIKSKLK